MLRVVHHLSLDHADELPRYTASLPGEVDLRAFRSARGEMTLLELWPDSDRFAAYSADSEWEFWRLFSTPSELYPQQRFTRSQGVWHTIGDTNRAVVEWGNPSGVRVFYQFLGSTDDFDPQISSTIETLREPGCLQFEHASDIDDPKHILLTELWSDQATYDAHWHLRMITGTPPNAPLDSGASDVIEFYRHAEFICLYGIWMPAERCHRSRSQSVRWSA